MSMGESEKKVEAYLVKKVGLLGGIAFKFVSPQRRSVPDRLCIFPTGVTMFIECKGEFGVLSKGQIRELKRLTDLGASVAVVRSTKNVDECLDAVREAIDMRRRLK